MPYQAACAHQVQEILQSARPHAGPLTARANPLTIDGLSRRSRGARSWAPATYPSGLGPRDEDGPPAGGLPVVDAAGHGFHTGDGCPERSGPIAVRVTATIALVRRFRAGRAPPRPGCRDGYLTDDIVSHTMPAVPVQGATAARAVFTPPRTRSCGPSGARPAPAYLSAPDATAPATPPRP